jgi:hypothetical protein
MMFYFWKKKMIDERHIRVLARVFLELYGLERQQESNVVSLLTFRNCIKIVNRDDL